ncbi:MAG TPA: DUF1223 domain-containing protein [Xanthobacteraceae bacterium]|nr:DUF1223 domain-containing protein [Xanthobacteraceae bacterium]
MVRRCLALAVFAVCSALPASSVLAGPRAIVELFTSQGCSSCPAADKLLGEMINDPSLVAISLPMDVWDYLGWKDTLADPRNTARWQAYSKSRGDRERYTPQVVVNGAAHALGSDRSAIEKAIVKSRQNEAVMSVPVNAARNGDGLTITLPDGTPAAAATVTVWALAKAVTVMITRGENKGRTVTYHNVMRRLVNLGPWNATTNRWTVPLRDLAGDGIDSAAVLVQTGTPEMPSIMLGAAMAPLR